jgi:WD40 repeat protein
MRGSLGRITSIRGACAAVLISLVIACQGAPLAIRPTPTETLPPTQTPPPIATVTQTLTSTSVVTATVSPGILKEQAGPICENSFSALFERGPLSAPFAVLKKTTYADAPAWELSHPLPHLSSLSAVDVRTILCISETRTQSGTDIDGSPAYQLFWDVRAVSFPDGKVIGRNSFTGPPPPKTKAQASTEPEGLVPYATFAGWVFDQVEHPDFLYLRDAVTTVAVSPDGRVAAFGTSIANQIVDKEFKATITLFNPASLQRDSILDVLDGHQGMVTSLAFSPDGRILASSGVDFFVKFWDVGTGRLLGQVALADTPNSLAFPTNGTQLAVASNVELVLIDSLSRQVSASIPGAGGDVLAFSPEGDQIYVHSLGSIRMIDPTAKRITLTFPDRFALVPTLSVSADGSITGVTYESPGTVDGFAVSPDIARIVSFTMDRTVESDPPIENVRLATWDSTTGKYISEVIFSGEFIRSMEFSADGKFLAIGNGSDIWLWDAYNWQLKQKLTGHIGNIVDIAFLPDGKKVLSAGSDGTVRSWALQE